MGDSGTKYNQMGLSDVICVSVGVFDVKQAWEPLFYSLKMRPDEGKTLI